MVNPNRLTPEQLDQFLEVAKKHGATSITVEGVFSADLPTVLVPLQPAAIAEPELANDDPLFDAVKEE